MTTTAAPRPQGSTFLWQLWLAYGAWCACTGWLLSAIGFLGGKSYFVFFAVAVVIGLILFRRSVPRLKSFLPRARRFRRPLPLIYLLLLAGSLIGGIVYPPNNYDMLTYRLPRMLNWLADGRWHWINGYIDRMNYSGTGFEWSAMPLLLLARGTSLFFLINLVSYLFLPGLFFALLRQFGVGGRVAWKWMWIFPAGLNFVMQAGGGANDTVAVVYLLAALVLALRARRSGRVVDAYWSLIAAALMTATKLSNLPLALPCAIAVVPMIRLRQNWIATAAVVVVAAMSSVLPTLILNYKITGDPSGSPGDPGKLKVVNPIAGIVGNTLQAVSTNLQPPVMPLAKKWNEKSEKSLPAPVRRLLARDFPRFTLHTGELPQEESAGLGLGVTAIALISFGATLLAIARSADPRGNRFRPPGRWPILFAGLVSLLAFIVLIGSESSARLLSCYYPLMIVPLLLNPVNDRLVRKTWWNVCAVLAVLAVVPGLILTPARPLFPAVRLLNRLAAKHHNSTAIDRAATVYRVYGERADNLAPLRKYIPAGARDVGIIGTLDTSESSLWFPLFSRRVVEVMPDDTPATLGRDGVTEVVVEGDALKERHTTLEQIQSRLGGSVVGHEQITLRASEGPEDWYVIDLSSPRKPAR